ncbi:SEC-C domain-containing protein [Nocardioides sp. HDW12B]|uniref:DUF5926 family protein n=1 Tax=Nocardioides sp. HDW12B TaxID=2714939 RepID=UPI00140879DB|nr:DUF5926 family protein [Nocardioides sp. HDW12B]QIK67828.1 SEC-C domain-containing protein [Nocardioides sp. HDW12B]
MGKRSRDKARQNAAQNAAASPDGVSPRQPCPCGSGLRYRSCHGSATGAPPRLVTRPFAGLAAECDLVALRELVPAATAPLPLVTPGERDVLLATLLPVAAPAMVRDNGTVWLGLQVQHAYGDPSRDLGAVLEAALVAEPGQMVGLTDAPGEGPRLQELVVDEPLDITVHEGFEYWIADVDDDSSGVAAALEQANQVASPTARLTSVTAAYWTAMGSKEHLRWVMPHDEEVLLSALARLHLAGEDRLVADSRLVGMFRAHSLLAPVWDLPAGTGAEVLEEPAARFATALDEAMTALTEGAEPLTTEERSARHGLANRQVTIR